MKRFALLAVLFCVSLSGGYAGDRQADPRIAAEPTVYITKTGEKYHADGCKYLRKSKIAILLSAAKEQGYDPCSVCKPPK